MKINEILDSNIEAFNSEEPTSWIRVFSEQMKLDIIVLSSEDESKLYQQLIEGNPKAFFSLKFIQKLPAHFLPIIIEEMIKPKNEMLFFYLVNPLKRIFGRITVGKLILNELAEKEFRTDQRKLSLAAKFRPMHGTGWVNNNIHFNSYTYWVFNNSKFSEKIKRFNAEEEEQKKSYNEEWNKFYFFKNELLLNLYAKAKNEEERLLIYYKLPYDSKQCHKDHLSAVFRIKGK